ncbi:MAG: serine/threonine-protein kinase [Planctomycetota bacterium]
MKPQSAVDTRVRQPSLDASGGRRQGETAARPPQAIYGIWRVGKPLAGGSDGGVIAAAQPADAAGSGRWDYAIRLAGNSAAGRGTIRSFVASAAAANHPNLIAVLDASPEASQPYLVMPRLVGRTLADTLRRRKDMRLPVVLWIIRQVSQALESLHAAGWVHGDVKPANVFIDRGGHTTLMDLGFANRVHTVRRGVFAGTPDYAAPEATSGEHAAIPAMDVFSLGRTLWRSLLHGDASESPRVGPVADLIASMVHPQPAQRPTIGEVTAELLRLELATLGEHIRIGQPGDPADRQAA